uniref:Uncharacterized LOC105927282 n=1 Tax=Fundulus heteroclitus TaxID=8078 RepID=A0A3Q2QZF0_FUNHE
MRDSNIQVDPAMFMANSPRQVHSPANGLSVRELGKIKMQFVGCKPNNSEKDQKEEITDSTGIKLLSSELSYRVCIRHEMPLRSWSSAVFLDKSLCISLAELAAGTRGVQAPLYRSALTCQLGVQSLCRSTTDKKSAKAKEVYKRTNFNRCDGPKQRLDHRGSPLSKRRGHRANQKAPACGVNIAPGTTSKQGGSQKTDEDQESGKSTEPQTISTCHHTSQLKDNFVGDAPKPLSLKEALELFRPDFISRSQGRVRRLEQRARRRKALQNLNPDLVHGLIEDQGKQKRNCTTPDPLSDNLFKPRERSISGREMQLRSRRIYNKLPEVTKKKEDEKKRAVSQTNRLRAEVFKRRLLDQILQR